MFHVSLCIFEMALPLLTTSQAVTDLERMADEINQQFPP
jgi:hypothetical protein